MDSESVTQIMKDIYEKAVIALNELSRYWEQHPEVGEQLFTRYPDYLPSFDEFTHDFMGMDDEPLPKVPPRRWTHRNVVNKHGTERRLDQVVWWRGREHEIVDLTRKVFDYICAHAEFNPNTILDIHNLRGHDWTVQFEFNPNEEPAYYQVLAFRHIDGYPDSYPTYEWYWRYN